MFAKSTGSPEQQQPLTRSRSRTRESAGSNGAATAAPRRDTTEWRETANRLSQRVRELEHENRLLKSGSRPPSLSLIEPPRTFAGGEMSAMLHAAKAAEAEDALLEPSISSARPNSALATSQSLGPDHVAAKPVIAKSKSYASGFGYTGLTVAEAVAASHRARTRKSALTSTKPVEKLRAGYWNGANNVKSSFSCNNLADIERRDLAFEQFAPSAWPSRGAANGSGGLDRQASSSSLSSTSAAPLPPPSIASKANAPPVPVLEKANSTNTRGATRGHRDAAALMNSFARKASISSSTASSAAAGAHDMMDNDFGATHKQQLAIATSFHAPETTLQRDSMSFRSVADTSVEDDDTSGGEAIDAFATSQHRVTSPRSLQEASLRSTGSLMAPRRTGSSKRASASPPKRPSSSSDVRMWVGTWNMGAADPFADGNGIIDEQRSGAMLQHLLPHGYQLYVLGVQEGVSENVYHAVEAYLNRNASGMRYYRMELRNSRFQLANKNHPIDAVIDAVHGRGDGAFVGTKFTGLAVFTSAAVQDKVKLVRAGVHKFNITSGSKGGVAVALLVHNTTIVFVNCHLDARNDTYRREQVRTLNAQLGKVMGHYAFDLTEQFHHVVWMGDMNYRIVHLDPQMVLHMLAEGRNLELHDKFDGLLNDRRASGIFEGFTEPNKFPDFYPTYKKLPKRGFVNEALPSWPTLVYRVLYKEPFYKGGKVKKRVPGWCDRILLHSLLVSDSKLLPEKVESPFDHEGDGDGDASSAVEWIDNYRSVNHGHGMDVSDHSPVFATFVLSFPGLGRKDAASAKLSSPHARPTHRTTRAHSTFSDAKDQQQAQAQPFRPSAVTGSYFDQPKVVRHLHSVRPVSTVLIVSHMQLYWNDKALVPKKTRVVAPLVGEDLKQCDVIGERTHETHASSAPALSLSLNALIQHSRPLEQLHMLVWVKNDAIVGHCTLSLKRIARQDEGGEVRFRVPLYNNSMRLYHEGHPLLLVFSVRSKTFAK